MSQAVPALSVVGMAVTFFICLAVPAALWIVAARGKRGVSISVLFGALGFVLPQLCVRIPALQLLALCDAWAAFAAEHTVLYLILLALMAALFESFGRLLVLKVFLKKRRGFEHALGAGVGHGGSEAVLLIGLTYMGNIIMSILINSGSLPDVPGLQGAVSALCGTDPLAFFLAGAERVFTIVLHIALSVTLAYFIRKNRAALGMLLIILLHTAVDFFVPLMSAYGVSIYLTEGVMAAVAVMAAVLILAVKRAWPREET